MIRALAKIEKAVLRLLSALDSLINIQLLNFIIDFLSTQWADRESLTRFVSPLFPEGYSLACCDMCINVRAGS